MHVKALISSMHVPPFRHGAETHSPISNRKYQKKPNTKKLANSFRSYHRYDRECSRTYNRRSHQNSCRHSDMERTRIHQYLEHKYTPIKSTHISKTSLTSLAFVSGVASYASTRVLVNFVDAISTVLTRRSGTFVDV